MVPWVAKGREKQHQVSRRDAKRRPGPSSDSTHLRKRETESTSEDETKKEKPSEPESNSSVQLEERSRDGGGPDLSDGLEEEERDRNQRLFLFSSRQFSPRGTTTTHPSDDHRIDKAEDDVQDDEPGEDGLVEGEETEESSAHRFNGKGSSRKSLDSRSGSIGFESPQRR